MKNPPSAGRALALLTTVNLLNYVDRYVPAGALPLILPALGATDAQGGLIQSLFMIPYALVSPVSGALGDRGRRFLLAGVGAFVWSLATLGSGLAPTLALFLAARVFVGVGEASYSVVTPSLLSDYYEPARRSRALAFFYAAIPIGSAIGFMTGSVVGTHVGWRSAFLIAGAPGLVLALLLCALRDPPRAEHAGAQRADLTDAGSFSDLLRRPSYVVNVCAQTIYTFSMGGLAHWMPTYFARVRGLPLDRAGLLFGAVVCLAGLLGTLAGGHVADALNRRWPTSTFTVPGAALVASLPFTLAALLSPSPAIFWPSMFVTLFLLFVSTGPLNAAIANVLPPTLWARGFGASTLCIHMLGDALSPLLVGLASDRVGLAPPVLATGLLLVLAGIVLLAGRRTLARDLAGRVGA